MLNLSEPRGLFALAERLAGKETWQHEHPIHVTATDPHNKHNTIEALVIFTDRETETHAAFCNSAAISQSSAPVTAIRSAAARGITDALTSTYGKPSDLVSTQDLRSGMLVVTKILHTNPAYDSQTKERLINTDLTPFINAELTPAIAHALLKDHDTLEKVHKHIQLIVRAREAARAAKAKAMAGKEQIDIKPKAGTVVSLDIYTPPLKKDQDPQPVVPLRRRERGRHPHHRRQAAGPRHQGALQGPHRHPRTARRDAEPPRAQFIRTSSTAAPSSPPGERRRSEPKYARRPVRSAVQRVHHIDR